MVLASSYSEYYDGWDGTSVMVQEGLFTTQLIIGDDYLTTNTRQLEWVVSKPINADVGDFTCKFRIYQTIRGKAYSFEVEGTIAELGLNWTLSFSIPSLGVAAGLVAGKYNWSVVLSSDTSQITTTISSIRSTQVELLENQ